MNRDAEHWDRLQALFHLGEHTSADDLDAQLLAAEPDAELRRRARALILARRAEAPDPPIQAALPNHIGPYRVLKHLGTGGMGAVYLVERHMGGAVQRAALKMLSKNAVGPFFLDRFGREQYILATLDHLHITRMLDAGFTGDSDPYLVMEYVDGLHLDVYCDSHSLDIPARLKLFVSICDAIAYAHRNLVVHLDLKPSNILVVEADGRPKVLDFGTSKLITADGAQTTTLMVTPAYASPEQLRSEPVTTSCDIYALGAILYELLAGQRPNFERSISTMIERSIREQAPEPVTEAVTEHAAERRGLTTTRLRSLLSGDLATIVAKCLRPRPQERYPNVDALIADIDLYLAGRPVLARPQTTTYRLSKFVRRNRNLVVVTLLAAMAMAASLGYAGWRQQQALREANRALAMQTFMAELFTLANSDHTGKAVTTVPEFLQLGLKVVPSLINDPGDRRAAQLSLATSMASDQDYLHAEAALMPLVADARAAHDLPIEAIAEARLGEVEDELGHSQQSLDLTAHALTLADTHHLHPAECIEIRGQYAYLRENNGFQQDATLKMLQDNLAEARKLKLADTLIAVQGNRLALILQQRGRLEEADNLFRQSLKLYQQMPYALCDEGLMYRFLGHNRSQVQDFQGSVDLYEKAYDRLRRCSGDDSLKTLAIQGYIANAMLRLGKPEDAVKVLESSMPHWRKAAGPESMSLATPLLFLSRAYIATGQFDKAVPTAEELVRLIQGKMNRRSSTVGVCEEALAQALAGQHRYAEALQHAHIAVDAFPEKMNPGETVNLAKAKQTLAEIEHDAK